MKHKLLAEFGRNSARNYKHVDSIPLPLWARATRWWVEEAHVSWPSSWWLEASHAVWVGAILGEASSAANFLGDGKGKFGVKESQFAKGCHLSPVFEEGGLKPILRFQPARLVGEGFVSYRVAMWSVFLTMSPDFDLWQCH